MIQLTPEQKKIVLEILQRHVPDRPVFAFGSRVKGRTKPFSDLDLAIMGDAPLPLNIEGDLREDFSASDLPFRVDLVDWATTSDEFRQVIKRDGEIFYQPPVGS